LFFGALFNHNPSSLVDVVVLFSATFISCLVLARVTEHKKYWYKKSIVLVWEKVEKRIQR